jgi:hypothetical protein
LDKLHKGKRTSNITYNHLLKASQIIKVEKNIYPNKAKTITNIGMIGINSKLALDSTVTISEFKPK